MRTGLPDVEFARKNSETVKLVVAPSTSPAVLFTLTYDFEPTNWAYDSCAGATTAHVNHVDAHRAVVDSVAAPPSVPALAVDAPAPSAKARRTNRLLADGRAAVEVTAAAHTDTANADTSVDDNATLQTRTSSSDAPVAAVAVWVPSCPTVSA